MSCFVDGIGACTGNAPDNGAGIGGGGGALGRLTSDRSAFRRLALRLLLADLLLLLTSLRLLADLLRRLPAAGRFPVCSSRHFWLEQVGRSGGRAAPASIACRACWRFASSCFLLRR